MDEAEENPDTGLAFPGWLDSRLVTDARFARAYNACGDSGRAQLKRIIAAHYALNPPRESLAATRLDLLRSGLSVATDTAPATFAVILCDGGMDAPAFLLSALVPALCSGIPEVLVVRLGGAVGLSNSTLAACELAGQERVAALGPAQVERLLAHCAASGLPGVLLHADTAPVRAILARPGLRSLPASTQVRRVALAPPAQVALWRDSKDDFSPDCVALAYGDLPFEEGGLAPGEKGRKPAASAFEAFALAPRDLLLAPDGRMALSYQAAGQGARVTVSRSQLGMWAWDCLCQDVFLRRATVFSSER